MDSRPTWMSLPLFQGLGSHTLARLSEAMEPVAFREGDVVMTQGALGDEMFVIEEGQVHVVVGSAEWETVFETDLSAPALVGEMALVTNEPRTATVTAHGAVRGQRIRRRVIEDLFARHPQAASFLTTLVGERLMETQGIRRVGKYEVMGSLGSGGVATVFEARHPELGHTVALKMLSHALVYNRQFADHFGREARIVASLTHDHIVRVLDTEEAYGTRFIVMERLTGELLEALIQRRDPLDWSTARGILADVAEALAYSHERGLIHRDVKPSNVFMTTERQVKLLDFGVAVAAGTGAGSDGSVIGTPHYMSPEQIRGLPLDGRSDLYSLGIMAYELCTGARPCGSTDLAAILRAHIEQPTPDPRALEPDLPDDLAEFILRSTKKDPAARFPSCREATLWLRAGNADGRSEQLEMSTLGVTYPTTRRVDAQRILDDARAQLRRLRGVQALLAHTVQPTPVGQPQPAAVASAARPGSDEEENMATRVVAVADLTRSVESLRR